jgi:hypothetical protein
MGREVGRAADREGAHLTCCMLGRIFENPRLCCRHANRGACCRLGGRSLAVRRTALEPVSRAFLARRPGLLLLTHTTTGKKHCVLKRKAGGLGLAGTALRLAAADHPVVGGQSAVCEQMKSRSR